jgi:hypothetical protein
MPTSLRRCAALLTEQGVPHHLDVEEKVVRVVFATEHYRNARGEALAIARIEAANRGRRCRVSLERAFVCAGRLEQHCTTGCRLAAETPLVKVEHDAAGESLRLVVETVVDDGRLTGRQLVCMLDAVVSAAEAWQPAFEALAAVRLAAA